MNILLVEDEQDMAKIVQMYLEGAGYQVAIADNGMMALELLYKQQFDLAIIDWMLPMMDGIALCKAIRQYQMPLKIIMLTAKSKIEDEITGLQCGIDDYIKKPFDPQVLLLRVKRLLNPGKILSRALLSMDLSSQTVTKEGHLLKLTKIEYHLLKLLMENPEVIFSREKLLDRIWGMDYDGDMRTVDTHIRRLRKKIGEDNITTHVGLGYSMGRGL